MSRSLSTLGKTLLLGALLVPGVAACPPAPASRPDAPAVTFLAEAATYERAARDARMKYRERNYRGAVQSYAKALAANPGDEQVLYFLARAALRAGDPATALSWLRRLAEVRSDLVPTPEDFPELVDSPEFRSVSQDIAAQAARRRHAVEAFRVAEPGLLAEGIAYDPVGHAFYMGSGKRRKVIKIIEGKPPEDFTTPRAEIDSIGGLRVDAGRRRLWLVSGTDERMDGFVASEPERNALVEIDLDSRAIVATYPLTEPGHHVLNDVEIDARGVPFATDTASGQIYTLGDDRRGLVAVFATPPYLGPNGIATDDKGKLLFVADATGIHRLDIATRTTRRLAQPRGSSLGLLDGLYFVRVADGARLVGIQGQARGRVLSATLSPALDAITSTQVLESAHPLFDGPTTGAVVGASIYVIANSQLWYPREPRETIVVKLPLAI
jgi:hypothetical protein